MDLIDTRTAIFFLGLSSIIVILIYLSFIILTKSKNWCLITFIIGKIFQTLGLIGLGLRYILPEFISITLGSIFLFIGWAFEIFGMISFDLVFRKKNFYTMLVSTIIFIILAIVFSGSPDYQRAIIFSLAIAFFFGFGGIYFIQLSSITKFRKLIGFSYTIFSFGCIINIASLLIQKDSYQFLISESATSDIVNLLALFTILFGSVGLLFVIKERDEIIIQNDNRELKLLNSKKNKFFSIIAHDLRNPIGGLTQLGQILLEDHNEISAKGREEIITLITNSSKKTYNLLENLLQWSRSESGLLNTNPVKLNIAEIIDEVVNLLRENISKKGISIKEEIPERLKAFGDYNMISTVIRNILSNAIKFVHENGNIWISCEEHITDHKINIDISDDGVGIEDSVLNKLFDIDSNHSTTGTNNETGTGLGLKLCKEFITKNKGEITVKSELNKGSTFTIILPISE